MKQNCDGKNYQANPQVVCVKNEEDYENLPTRTDDEVEFYILQHQFDHSGMTSLSPFPTGVRMYTISFPKTKAIVAFFHDNHLEFTWVYLCTVCGPAVV